MENKPLAWAASAYKDLTDDNIFPLEARKIAGKQLRKVQRGDEPDDWKPFDEIGAGTKEIRIKLPDGAFRVMYVAKFSEAAYSRPNWTHIPRQTGQAFQRKLDTDSTANWTVVPAQTGQV